MAPSGETDCKATRYLRQEGITHIVAPTQNEVVWQIGQLLDPQPAEWGLEYLASESRRESVSRALSTVQ